MNATAANFSMALTLGIGSCLDWGQHLLKLGKDVTVEELLVDVVGGIIFCCQSIHAAVYALPPRLRIILYDHILDNGYDGA